MIEISLNKVNKNYGYNKVLDNLSFDIKTNERVALIGSNGSGKTTTLRLINGEELPDSGNIFVRKNTNVGYLTQMPPLEHDNILAKDVFLRGVKHIICLEKELNDFSNSMSSSDKDIKKLNDLEEKYRILGGYELNTKIEKISHGFKLTDLLNNKYNNLSGGEKTIVNLASLILSSPDILLLDEPTNHLDIETLEWFEEYLNNYKGTVIIVSHDRYFLDKVINKIICLEHGNEDIYFGNYSYFLKESEHRFLLQFQKYKNQQVEIKAIKEAIARLKEWGTKSDNPIFFKRAAAMQKRLDKMELVSKPIEKKDLNLSLKTSVRSSNHILTIDNINLSFPNKNLLINASMNVYYQERVCLMGKNGTGKTTLIKTILDNNNSSIKIGNNIIVGYIPQEIRFNDDNQTIYEYARSFFVGSESLLRSKLFEFYFGEESISKKLKNISGGEKVRLKLLELILKNSNFLILDEPTNHIDIDTREILEESLLNFEGTILFVSHDRYFINKMATRIIRIENNEFVSYDGNYDSIKEKNIPQIMPNKKENIIIKGSNRLNEFLKDANSIIEETIGCSNQKVYKIRKKSKVYFLKIADHLSEESIKLDYLKDKILVPEKVFYEKYNGKSYILTKSLKGIMLCDDYYCDINPSLGIDIIISAFNALYNIDYSDCIIDETIDAKISKIEQRFSLIDEKSIDEEILKRFHNKEGILKYLKGNKPKQIIGFIHGDMSLPNIFADNNEFSGLLDVSDCGLGDIYYDLVVCEISIERNYGKEYANMFYDKIGIEKDEFKSDYYRILLSL